MRQAAHAEWTKVRTTASARWLVAGFVIVAVVCSAAVAAAVRHSTESIDRDGVDITLTGIVVAQAIIAVLAVLTISGEYSTGMIRITLTAVPRRTALLAAKAAVVCIVTSAAAAVAVAGCLLVGWAVLRDATVVAGFSLTDASTIRTGLSTIVHVVLIALLSLGVATVVRDSAAGVGAALGLIYLFPIVTVVVSDPDWQRRLQDLGPMTADLDVMVVWAAAGLVAGAVALRCRDA